MPPWLQSPDAIAGWRTAEAGIVGSVASLSATTAPGSGRSTVGAKAGTNYALLDLSQPSYSVLYQSFTVGAAGIRSGQLRYDAFATSFAGTEPPDLSPFNGFDFNGNDAMLTLRVDILKPGAALLTTARADIVRSYVPTVEYFGNSLTTPTAYSSYLHPLGALDLLAGQTYTLRFAAAANSAAFIVGIDNVSIDVSPVPEPATLASLLAGLALFTLLARHRR